MSIYEATIKENNNKLEQQIKKLQSQIKPVENPIIAKIIPFLPYDNNKLILDKLDIEKQKYLLESEFDELVRCFVHNKTKYYTEDTTYWERLPHNTPCFCCLKYSLNYCIREKIDAEVHFEYENDKVFRLLSRFMREKIWTIQSPNKDIENCIRNIDEIYAVIDMYINDVQSDLGGLGTIYYDRSRHVFTIYDDYDNCNEYQIFKSNGSINSKPYKNFLGEIRNIIIEGFEDKILNVLTRFENIKQK